MQVTKQFFQPPVGHYSKHTYNIAGTRVFTDNQVMASCNTCVTHNCDRCPLFSKAKSLHIMNKFEETFI
jgi:hypothetical protein